MIDRQDPYFTCAVGGDSVVIEKDANDIPLWYYEMDETVKGSKPICIGHISYQYIELKSKRLFALDTGAAKKGNLTAVILPECRIVQIPSARNYHEESRQEWSRIELGRYTPDRLPIKQYFTLIKKEEADEHEKIVLNEFNNYLKSQDIESTIESLKQDVINTIGEVPASGPERGNYFISVRNIFPSVNHRLINMILSPKKFNIHTFLRLFEGSDLFTAMEALETIQKEVKRNNIAEQGALLKNGK